MQNLNKIGRDLIGCSFGGQFDRAPVAASRGQVAARTDEAAQSRLAMDDQPPSHLPLGCFPPPLLSV